MRKPLAAFTVAAGLALALLTGCGADRDTSTSAAAVEAGAVPFAKMFAGYSADYDAVESPGALAKQSTVVVQGRLDRITAGRVLGTSTDDPAAGNTVVAVFTVDRALHGRAPAGGKVYVELPAPGGFKAEAFERRAPKGANAVLYLTAAPTRANMPIVDEAAGRPAGQPLFQPANPQGFIIDDGTAVVQVIEHIQFRGAKLADFIPSASRFPLDRASHLD